MKCRKEVWSILSALTVLMLISLVSGGLFDKSTGKASDAPQDVAVTVQGINSPIVSFVENFSSADPTEFGITTVVFETHVYDPDGVGNINDSSVNAEFSFGATTRSGSCTYDEDLDSFTANYSCSVDMTYYDEASSNWNINVSALDQEANYAENTSMGFTYTELKAFDTPLTPSQLSWPALAPAATNQNATNDPTVVNNTGNYNGNIYITAYDLVGQTTSTENISANNFSVSGTSGLECTGAALGPDGGDADTSIAANPGPAGSNLADIYYCIPTVPVVSSQVYSTTARGQSWVVRYV